MSISNNNHEPRLQKHLDQSAPGSIDNEIKLSLNQALHTSSSGSENQDLLTNILKQIDLQQELLIKLVEQNQFLALEVQNALNERITPGLDQNKLEDRPVIEVARVDHLKKEESPLIPEGPLPNLPFLYQFQSQNSGESHYLSSEESEALRNKFNATDVTQSETVLLHKMFEEVALKKPDVPAVVYHYQFLSYGELNQQANQLARYLRAQGIYEGDAIGISLPRSIDQFVAILAVLKCGGTFIPIDAYETDRRFKIYSSQFGYASGNHFK